MTDDGPRTFIDAEIVVERLDKQTAAIDELIGRVEALQATLDGLNLEKEHSPCLD